METAVSNLGHEAVYTADGLVIFLRSFGQMLRYYLKMELRQFHFRVHFIFLFGVILSFDAVRC